MNGTVTYYHPARNFGFVEDAHGSSWFFFNEPTEHKRRRRFYSGDEVSFELIPDPNNPTNKAARIIEYIGNENYNALLEQVRNDPKISGYLKQFLNGKWAIKHIPSKIFIELKGPSLYEEDIEFVYNQRLNEWVGGIVKLNKHDEMSAVLEDRRFIPEFHLAQKMLESGEIISGIVTGQNEDVVFIELLNGAINATILKKKFEMDYALLKKHEPISVKIVGVSDSSIRLEPCQKLN